jgi:hypothetical protein
MLSHVFVGNVGAKFLNVQASRIDSDHSRVEFSDVSWVHMCPLNQCQSDESICLGSSMVVDFCYLIDLYTVFEMFLKGFQNGCAVGFEITTALLLLEL